MIWTLKKNPSLHRLKPRGEDPSRAAEARSSELPPAERNPGALHGWLWTRARAADDDEGRQGGGGGGGTQNGCKAGDGIEGGSTNAVDAFWWWNLAGPKKKKWQKSKQTEVLETRKNEGFGGNEDFCCLSDAAFPTWSSERNVFPIGKLMELQFPRGETQIVFQKHREKANKNTNIVRKNKH